MITEKDYLNEQKEIFRIASVSDDDRGGTSCRYRYDGRESPPGAFWTPLKKW